MSLVWPVCFGSTQQRAYKVQRHVAALREASDRTQQADGFPVLCIRGCGGRIASFGGIRLGGGSPPVNQAAFSR